MVPPQARGYTAPEEPHAIRPHGAPAGAGLYPLSRNAPPEWKWCPRRRGVTPERSVSLPRGTAVPPSSRGAKPALTDHFSPSTQAPLRRRGYTDRPRGRRICHLGAPPAGAGINPLHDCRKRENASATHCTKIRPPYPARSVSCRRALRSTGKTTTRNPATKPWTTTQRWISSHAT